VSLWAWWEVVAAHHHVRDYACCHLQADCRVQLHYPTLDPQVSDYLDLFKMSIKSIFVLLMTPVDQTLEQEVQDSSQIFSTGSQSGSVD